MARRVALSLWMLAALLVVTTLTASGIEIGRAHV